MSHDAFALPPAAARSPQPSEAEYHALCDLLSATARGRWFLSEFAKRNRNSETGKMLDAVARIEQAVAARPALAAGGADFEIARTWALAARAEASASFNSSDRSNVLAAAQRGARIVREIAYSMRAVGNDPRICNILDEQLDAIEAAHAIAEEPAQRVLASFDRLIAQLDELAPAPLVAPAVVEAWKLAEDEPDIAPNDPAARFAAVADLAAACATGDPAIIEPSPAEHAEDDAILERIAFEMASAAEDDVDEPTATEPPASKSELDALPSLGEMLLTQGIVRAETKPGRDPFAALRRLSQAETIALFT